MGTVVYQQGFQSYLESQLNEPRALRLRLSSPNPHYSQPFGLALKSHFLESSTSEETRNQNDGESFVADSSGWSPLQSLASSSLARTSSDEKEKTYVPRPSSCRALSDESLALCTENLGSETGSDANDVEDLFLLDVETKNLGETTRLKSKKRSASPSDLPTPLTSMRGSQCIQMRPHREDGRLVMTATNAPPRNRCFQADRSNGRLRLSILKDSDESAEIQEETIDQVMGMENVETSRTGDRKNRALLNWESLCVATS